MVSAGLARALRRAGSRERRLALVVHHDDRGARTVLGGLEDLLRRLGLRVEDDRLVLAVHAERAGSDLPALAAATAFLVEDAKLHEGSDGAGHGGGCESGVQA